MSKKHSQILKTPQYGNYKVLSPNGSHMFTCGEKKANWYLRRGLADIIQETPPIIQINFEPNGPGNADNQFFLQGRQNICVSCGSDEQLTRHHIVPFCYRKHMPDNIKNHDAYDVMPLCHECHEKYEKSANKLKQEIAQELDIVKEKKLVTEIPSKVIKSAAAILHHGKSIPAEKKQELIKIIQEYFGREIKLDDIKEVANFTRMPRVLPSKSEYLCVIEKLSNDEIESFICRWRKHFILALSPKFLPDFWNVNRVKK